MNKIESLFGFFFKNQNKNQKSPQKANLAFGGVEASGITKGEVPSLSTRKPVTVSQNTSSLIYKLMLSLSLFSGP